MTRVFDRTQQSFFVVRRRFLPDPRRPAKRISANRRPTNRKKQTRRLKICSSPAKWNQNQSHVDAFPNNESRGLLRVPRTRVVVRSPELQQPPNVSVRRSNPNVGFARHCNSSIRNPIQRGKSFPVRRPEKQPVSLNDCVGNHRFCV